MWRMCLLVKPGTEQLMWENFPTERFSDFCWLYTISFCHPASLETQTFFRVIGLVRSCFLFEPVKLFLRQMKQTEGRHSAAASRLCQTSELSFSLLDVSGRFHSSGSTPAAELLRPHSVCFVRRPRPPSLFMWITKESWVSIWFNNQTSVCTHTLSSWTPSVYILLP